MAPPARGGLLLLLVLGWLALISLASASTQPPEAPQPPNWGRLLSDACGGQGCCLNGNDTAHARALATPEGRVELGRCSVCGHLSADSEQFTKECLTQAPNSGGALCVVSDAYALSSQCADCYAGFAECQRRNCLGECLGQGLESDACRCCSTGRTLCSNQLVRCTGVLPDFPSTCPDGVSPTAPRVTGSVDSDAKAVSRNAVVAGSTVGVLCGFTAFVLVLSTFGVFG